MKIDSLIDQTFPKYKEELDKEFFEPEDLSPTYLDDWKSDINIKEWENILKGYSNAF